MAEASQGQVYRCDFGAEGGVELADRRFALVVSRDDYNRGSSSVLVVPTTSSGVDPLYIGYYPSLEQFDTRASCRNIRAFKADLLGPLQSSATRDEMQRVIRGAVFPHILSGVFYPPAEECDFAPGTVHNGFITNHQGKVEESWFLVLTCNDENGLATVAKVDEQPVGQSKVRVPLTAVDGTSRMAAYSHGVQTVDLAVSVADLDGPSYVGTVDRRSLIRVVGRLASLTRLPRLSAIR